MDDVTQYLNVLYKKLCAIDVAANDVDALTF